VNNVAAAGKVSVCRGVPSAQFKTSVIVSTPPYPSAAGFSTLDIGQASAGVAIFTGLALEAANFFFLAKRQRLRRLGDEIDEARTEGRSLEQKIREASRV
jgi:hypothetical protein